MAVVKELTPMDLFIPNFKIMAFGGNNPMHQTKPVRIYCGILLIILFFTFILAGGYLIDTNYESIGDVVIDIVVFGSVWQIYIKSHLCFFKNKDIAKYINKINTDFWTTDFCTTEEKKTIQNVYKYAKIVGKILTVGIGGSVSGHCITAIMKGNKNCPMNVWLPIRMKQIVISTPYYQIFVVFQTIYMNIATITAVLEQDLIFTIIIASIVVQIKLIKYKLHRIAATDSKKFKLTTLSRIIIHHNLLLDLLEKLEKTYSPMFLHMLGTNMCLAVISQLAILVEENMQRVIIFVFIYLSASAQFMLYCALGQIVQNETLSIADEVYFCNWENLNDAKMRVAILMIIRRSQKFMNFSMGGFVILCHENFTVVAKTMFSFFTFVTNMREKS